MKTSATKLHTAISRGLTFIVKQQTMHGSFFSETISSTPAAPQKNPETISRETTFYASLIASSLANIQATTDDYKAGINLIIKKACSFLLSEKADNWSFNYWSTRVKEHATLNCPNDLDATSCALIAINAARKDHIDEKVLAQIGQLLISCEEQPGGPYRTWLVDPYALAMWKDVDPVVNANIMRFLTMQQVELAPLTTYIEKCIEDDNYNSKYYKSPFAFFYFVSEWYRGPKVSLLISKILSLQKSNGGFGNSLETGLATISLYHLGAGVANNYTREKVALEKAIEKAQMYLLSKQQADGSWERDNFFIEEVKENIPWFSGCAAFTTSIVLEALTPAKAQPESLATEAIVTVKETVYTNARSLFNQPFVSPSFKKAGYEAVDRMMSEDRSGEISLLPYFFNHSLKKKYRVNDDTVLNLGTANVLGWLGYTTCDNILDGENEYTASLPIATYALRSMTDYFMTSLEENAISENSKNACEKVITRILTSIENATFWEHGAAYIFSKETPLTLPNYGDQKILAEKSLGHALGPILITLVRAGKDATKQASYVEEFFIHYLIARQINDDAHDWWEDVQQGFVNSASIHTLKSFLKLHTEYKDTSLNREEITVNEQVLRNIFWQKSIDTVCKNIHEHISKARTLLKKINILETTSYLESLLVPLENSAEKAAHERDTALRFIKEYTALTRQTEDQVVSNT